MFNPPEEEFLLALFLGVAEHMTNWTITVLAVKHAGITIPDPNLTSYGHCTVSYVVPGNPIADLR